MLALQTIVRALCVLIPFSTICTHREHIEPRSLSRYANYRLIQFTPMGAAQRDIFERLKHQHQGHIFLRSSSREGVSWLVAVPPKEVPAFEKYLEELRSYPIVNTDLVSSLEAADKQKNVSAEAVDWKSYQTLPSIDAWMEHIQSKYPQQAQIIAVGTSYENRTIRGVKIAYGGEVDKPGVFLECGIHAREWIGPAFGTYVINQLLTSTDPAMRRVAESYDWYIVPVVNPDGYVYTIEDRLWRKTRSPAKPGSAPECRGADPNRNWDIAWNTVGASDNQCADDYVGSAPFSEVECRSLSQYLHTIAGKLDVYISIHSFSQLLLYPHGYTDKDAKNKAQLEAIGEEAAYALSKRFGTEYVVGPEFSTIYPVSGSSLDYVYDKLNISLSYTYELRPKDPAPGSIGFDLPADQIIKVAEETLDSVIAMVRAAQWMRRTRTYRRSNLIDGAIHNERVQAEIGLKT